MFEVQIEHTTVATSSVSYEDLRTHLLEKFDVAAEREAPKPGTQGDGPVLWLKSVLSTLQDLKDLLRTAFHRVTGTDAHLHIKLKKPGGAVLEVDIIGETAEEVSTLLSAVTEFAALEG